MEIEDTEQEILLEPEIYAEVGDGILTIQKNNENIGTFNANSFTDETINIEVPVKTSDLENDSGYQTGSEVESAISTAVGAEATLRANADTALGGRIDNLVTGLSDETTARQNADNGLQGQIDAITASSDVTDIVGTKAQLNNYDTSKLNDNDIIKVLQDESQNDETTYYRWSTTTQSFTLIGEEGPYYTKAESNVLLQGKQDVLTAGTNINITNNVISATDTTYSAGNAITIDANNEISADIYPADYFTAEASMTETGSEVSFDDTIPASMSFDNLYGDSEQQTYTGKNLLYIPSGTSASNGITWTRSGNTVSGTGTGTGSYSATSDWLSYTLPAGTYTFSIGEAITKRVQFARRVDSSSAAQTVDLPAGDTSITFTSTEATSEYHVVLLDTSSASLTDFTIKDMQLEAGSEATSFEPYVGGIPAPNPEYPQDIHVVTGEQTVTVNGKNLWKPAPDGTSMQGGITSVRENGVITLTGTSTSTSTGTSAFYNLDAPLPAGTYTFSIPNPLPYRFEFVMQDSDGNTHFPVIPAGSTSNKITTTWETVKIRNGISGFTSGTEINLTIEGLQLEVGSTATEFQTYQSQSYTVDLGSTELCKIGDYQDYIYKSGDNWYVHKEIGKHTFNGSESWGEQSNYNTDSRMLFGFNATNVISGDNIANRTGISNNFIFTQVQSPNIDVTGFYFNTSANYSKWIYVKIQRSLLPTEDVTGFENWLANNNMIVYYQKTPTDTQITDAGLISQLDTLDTAYSYSGGTSIIISATGTNLPAIAKVTAIKNSASGIVKVLENAVTSAELDSRLGGLTLLPISQTDYDALSTKDPNTLYVITGA